MTKIPDPQAVQLYNLGSLGVILDVKPHLLPPEAWNNANNVVGDKNGIKGCKGHAQCFGTLSISAEFVMSVPGVGSSFWFYTSLTKAYVYEGGVHTNITRQTASSDVNYTGTAGRQWNGTILGGIPFINNGVDIPQYWSALNPATKLANFTAFVSPVGTLRANILRAFGEYLVALNVVDNGVRLAQAVYWSHKADPGTLPTSMDYTDPEVDAGRTFLTDAHGGQILDAGMLGDLLVIYKEYSTHTLRLVGGDAIMQPAMILEGSGIFAPRCFCSFMDGTKHFVVTANDIIVHAGTRDTKSLAQDRVKAIFNEIDPVNFVNSFVFENKTTKECWFCYPTIGATYPNRVARWDYINDTWWFRDFDGTSTDYGTITDASTDTWDTDSQVWDADSETWSNESRTSQVYVGRTTKAFKLETGNLFDTTIIPSFAERSGISIDGKDRQGNPKASLTSRKLLSRIWPKLSGSSQVTVRTGKQELLNDPVSWDSGQVFDIATQRYLDSSATPVNGTLLAIRYEHNAADTFALEGHDLYITKVGGQ